MATQIFIYYIGKEEESTADSAEECHPPPIVSGEGGYDLLEKKDYGRKIAKIKGSIRFR